MGHSEVDKARLVDADTVEINLVLPSAVKGTEYVVSAVVTQNVTAGRGQRSLAHGTFLFVPAADDEPAVFRLTRDPGGQPFDADAGIEARATATYSCWSSLDSAGEKLEQAGWTWELGEWA